MSVERITPTDKAIAKLNNFGYRVVEWGDGFILPRGGSLKRPDGSRLWARGLKDLKKELQILGKK